MATIIEGDVVITGKLIVGTPTTPTGTIEVQGLETAVRLQKYDPSPTAESYVAFFSPTTAGTMCKVAVLASHFADPDAIAGFGEINLHVTKLAAGVNTDEYVLAGWGGRGVKVAPYGITAAHATDPGMLWVSGVVAGPTIATLQAQIAALVARIAALEAA